MVTAHIGVLVCIPAVPSLLQLLAHFLGGIVGWPGYSGPLCLRETRVELLTFGFNLAPVLAVVTVCETNQLLCLLNR